MNRTRTKLLLMFQIGYLQGKVHDYETPNLRKPQTDNKHETIEIEQPMITPSLEIEQEVEEDTLRKKYRKK